MPEHVLLPIQKFKELVDYTKRVNDIITGFIKRKPKNENSEVTAIQPKARKRKADSVPKSEPAKKKSKSVNTAHEGKSKTTSPIHSSTPTSPHPPPNRATPPVTNQKKTHSDVEQFYTNLANPLVWLKNKF